MYGFVAILQPDANFGRPAYGGVFVAGSLLSGSRWMGFAPTAGTSGALIRLVGLAVIMYAPRPA